MKLRQITKILEAEVITTPDEDLHVQMGCGSDLMSDVLASTKPESILLTGLTNIQVVYTAGTVGIKAICFVRGKNPPKETVELAKKRRIALVATRLPMFESCGRLYKNGLIGCSETVGVKKK